MKKPAVQIGIFIVIPLILAAYYFVIVRNGAQVADITAGSPEAMVAEVPVASAEPEVRKNVVAVADGDVWNKVGERGGLSNSECYAVYDAVKDVYDLARMHLGNECVFYPDTEDRVDRIVYNVDDIRELIIERVGTSSAWTASLKPIPYEGREKTVAGAIDSSLYESALAAGADERAVLEFAESLEWSIDFASDPRLGDTYKFIYEERYLDGEYVRPGKVLAGVYVNDGKPIESFYFEENDGNKGYFDANGNSVQKMFLKAPLAFKYISSPFTTGRRYLAAFDITTGHRAVDYAATYGTPIRAVGDGTVTFAARNGAYGNMITIKHNETYSTNYAHQSKFAVKKGARVKQGQVIGYVGSTGLSTGPHLHYEMVKNGVKMNPASVVLPPGKPIGADRLAAFQETVAKMREKLSVN